MFVRISIALFAALLLVALLAPPSASQDDGGDVDFAKKVWKAMQGYRETWKLTSGVIEGQSPHGKLVQLYSSWVDVDGKLYPVLIKDNFGGRGLTQERAAKDPAKWLKAVTIMVQREKGYDPENRDWYWVKYAPDGAIAEKNGSPLAGKLMACAGCHSQADGKDYLFSNDPRK